MAHFLACVRGQEQPRATGEDGRAALALSLAVNESIRSGKVVELA
jgi:predicted dehydrogenase